jgi:hypothetical protein
MSCLVAFAVGEKWVQFFAFYYLFVLFMTLLLVWIYKLVLEIVSIALILEIATNVCELVNTLWNCKMPLKIVSNIDIFELLLLGTNLSMKFMLY